MYISLVIAVTRRPSASTYFDEHGHAVEHDDDEHDDDEHAHGVCNVHMTVSRAP